MLGEERGRWLDHFSTKLQKLTGYMDDRTSGRTERRLQLAGTVWTVVCRWPVGSISWILVWGSMVRMNFAYGS